MNKQMVDLSKDACRALMITMAIWFCTNITLAQPVGKQLITTQEGSWRSATVFTHVIWRDLMFYGGGAGADGGDPRHEIEIGIFHLVKPDSGYHHLTNPVITRKQFGLDEPGKGITPLSIYDRGDSLFMFCTSRPDDDLQPHIVVISASVHNPYQWGGYTTIVDKEFSGKENNHGASVMADPDNSNNILLYFAARSSGDAYRILLATAPVKGISRPEAYKLLNNYCNAVLKREGVKANYPFVRYDEETRAYELWYSGQTIGNPKTRSCFMTVSANKDVFEPAQEMVVSASELPDRNDNAYATGPKVYGNNMYYSGRQHARGNYVGIFYLDLSYIENKQHE